MLFWKYQFNTIGTLFLVLKIMELVKHEIRRTTSPISIKEDQIEWGCNFPMAPFITENKNNASIGHKPQILL